MKKRYTHFEMLTARVAREQMVNPDLLPPFPPKQLIGMSPRAPQSHRIELTTAA